MTWEVVIGLEIHAQLATKSKIFSGASTHFGALPNTQACAIDLGMPGMLPVLNEEAVNMAIKLGLAIGAQVAPYSVFSRKSYFYPDLPKGYQISQYELPVVDGGSVKIRLEDGSEKVIGITRAHLEEDAGKSLHEDFQNQTGIDLNRAGTPLLEIVSEPDIRSTKEAVAYAKRMHALVEYLGICDGNMQEGSFRMDANISLHRPGTPLGTRAELKNINSFRFLEKALEYEIDRQQALLESGGEVVQETRLYDAQKDETRSMRTKEEANDYRYFPDPDLLPLVISEDRIERIKQNMPELPDARKQRFIETFELPAYDAEVLTSSKALADFYDVMMKAESIQAKLAANWVMGDFLGALNKAGLSLSESPVSAKQLAQLVLRIEDKTISGKMAKDIFEIIWQSDTTVDAVIEEKGLKQITDTSAIEAIIDKVLENNPQQLADYRAGKDKLFGFFVGQTMKLSQGKASPDQVNQILKQKL